MNQNAESAQGGLLRRWFYLAIPGWCWGASCLQAFLRR